MGVNAVSLHSGVNSGACSSWIGKVAQCRQGYVLGGNHALSYKLYVGRWGGANRWDAGCYMKSELTRPGTKYILKASWHPYSNNHHGHGGHVHAMWGFIPGKKLASLVKAGTVLHEYNQMEFKFYCHAVNNHPYIYTDSHAVNARSCYCGTWAHTEMIIHTDQRVEYRMHSSQHGWRHCGWATKKATQFPYVVDTSFYGQRSRVDLTLSYVNSNGQTVHPSYDGSTKNCDKNCHASHCKSNGSKSCRGLRKQDS